MPRGLLARGPLAIHANELVYEFNTFGCEADTSGMEPLIADVT